MDLVPFWAVILAICGGIITIIGAIEKIVNADKARLKAESVYHQVLAAAAVSETMSHAAILFSSEGFPIMNQCYKHPTVVPTFEPVEEPMEEE